MSRSCAALFNILFFRSIFNRTSKRSFVSAVGTSLFCNKSRTWKNKSNNISEYISYLTKKRLCSHNNSYLFPTSSRSTSTMGSTPEVKALVETFIKDNKAMIFSKSYCPFCNKVKAIFDKLGVKYTAHELDLVENGADIQNVLLERTGQKTVPNTFINGKHLGGASDTEKAFSDGRLQEMLGNLRSYDYDLFVIGGGSGGLACSKEAVQNGVKVAVADFVIPSPIGTTWGLGGTCVNVGCIPKKLMHQSALLGESINDSRSYGWNIPVDEKITHDWEKMVGKIQDHIGSLNWGYKVQLRNENVKYYNSLASLVDKHTLKLRNRQGKEESVTAKNIVLAVGGRPVYPDVPGIKENCVTSDDIFSLPYAPGKTLVCGASYISLECAGFLHGLGFDVTVMVRSIFLRGFDQEMANKAASYMGDLGIKFLRQYNLVKVERLEEGEPGKIQVTFKTPDGEHTDVFNTVLVATGRSPCTDGIGLDDVGVKLNPKTGFVITDDYDQTNVDNIYAVGDVADGKPELTPVAIQAGRLLAKRLFAGSVEKCDYTNVPTTVFTPLEYGACGYSEEGAIEKFGEESIEVYHTNFTPLEATVPYRLQNGCFAKIITNSSDSNRVIGIHVLGPNAGEIIQGFSIALKLGATKADFDVLVGIHPTNAEVFTTMETTKRSGASIDVTGC